MFEQEIKLYVPVAARKAVAAELAALPGPRRMRLRAMYFDTPERQLARKYAALRLRQEGRRWVQTFKMAGADDVSRLELNHARPGPTLDLAVYVGTPAEEVLADVGDALVMRYETDVMRLTRQVQVRGGGYEIAYDVGAVRAGEFEIPIDEVEFERSSGSLRALFTAAGRMLREHGLILDARSKAERGDALVRAWECGGGADSPVSADEALAALWAPVSSKTSNLNADMASEAALLRVGGACYHQIVRNAAYLAGVDGREELGQGGESAEHVHQLRVGMRRLRSAWRLWRGWATPPADALQSATKRFFTALGEARDADVMDDSVAPALLQAGMPALELPQRQTVDVSSLVSSPAYQRWQLDVLAWTCGLRPARISPVAPSSASLDKLAARRLRKWHRKLIAEGRPFADLSDEARHELRKKTKRLRYGLAFTAQLFKRSRVKRYRKRLARLQEVLGQINDLVVAREHYAAMTQAEPHAWFAVGWLAARLETLCGEAEQALAELEDARPFWK